MAVEPIPLEVTPGVVQTASKVKNSLSWREVNLVRWNGGVMEPLRGWSQFNYTAPTYVVREIHVWNDNSKREWRAYLCDGKVYVEDGGDLVDISPTPALEQYSAGLAVGGYGDGVYGADEYGTPRPAMPDRKEAGPAFTMDNWGEDLLIMSSADGRLLRWVPNAIPAPCEVVPNAPTGCHSFVVTPERFVMVFSPNGAFNEFAWCDQEDIEDWNYADVASKAGKNPVEPSAPVVASLGLGEDGNLFFTTKKAYVTRFVGLPYVWSNGDEIGEGVAPVAHGVLVRALSGAIWANENGFWYYNGNSIEPIPCTIWAWLLERVDWVNARAVGAAVNMVDRSEYWLFLPETGQFRNTILAIYNYKDQWWSMGKMSRSAGFSSNFNGRPIMADELVVYQHDDSNQYPGAPEPPWAESYNVSLKSGGVFTTVQQLFPEIQGDYSNLRFRLAYTDIRTPNNEKMSGQRRVQSNGAVDMMVTARDFRLRIDYVGASMLPWGVGQILVAATPRGLKP